MSVIAHWTSASHYLLSTLRIFSAFIYSQYGAAKLFAYPTSMMPDGGTAHFPALAFFAGTLEFFGGSLLFLGLFTRPVAFILSGEMACAYFIDHFHKGFWPLLNGGGEAVLFCFLWLFLSSAGPGPLSLDALLNRTSKK